MSTSSSFNSTTTATAVPQQQHTMKLPYIVGSGIRKQTSAIPLVSTDMSRGGGGVFIGTKEAEFGTSTLTPNMPQNQHHHTSSDTENTEENFTVPCLERMYASIGLKGWISENTVTKHTEITCQQALQKLKERLVRVETELLEAEKGYEMAAAKLEISRAKLVSVLKVSEVSGTELLSSRDPKVSKASYRILLLNIKSEVLACSRSLRRFEDTCLKKEAILNFIDLVQATVDSKTDYADVMEDLDKNLFSISKGAESFKKKAVEQNVSAGSVKSVLEAIKDGNTMLRDDLVKDGAAEQDSEAGGGTGTTASSLMLSGGSQDEFQKFYLSCQSEAFPS
jgi:hypothetical protein